MIPNIHSTDLITKLDVTSTSTYSTNYKQFYQYSKELAYSFKVA